MYKDNNMLASRFLIRATELVTDIVVGLLAIRVLLKLLGASTAAPFVIWIYETTASILTPFQGMFPTSSLAPRLVIEFSSIFAMIIYAFIGYFLIDLIRMIDYRAGERIIKKRKV